MEEKDWTYLNEFLDKRFKTAQKAIDENRLEHNKRINRVVQDLEEVKSRVDIAEEEISELKTSVDNMEGM